MEGLISLFAPGCEAARISAIVCLAFEAGLSDDFFSGAFGVGAAGFAVVAFFSGAFGAGVAGFTAAAFFSGAFGAGAADFVAGLEAAVLATGLAAVLATGLGAVLATGLEVFEAGAFGAGAAGFFAATFFTSAGLDALGLAIGLATFLGLGLIGLAFDTGLAVGLAADFLAEVLEGICSFAAEERDIWRQFTY